MELNGSGDRYGFNEEILHQKILEYGFQSFTYLRFERKLISLKGKNMQFGNTLYVQNLEQVQERVCSAFPFQVNGQLV